MNTDLRWFRGMVRLDGRNEMHWMTVAAEVLARAFQSMMAASTMDVFTEALEGWVPRTHWNR